MFPSVSDSLSARRSAQQKVEVSSILHVMCAFVFVRRNKDSSCMPPPAITHPPGLYLSAMFRTRGATESSIPHEVQSEIQCVGVFHHDTHHLVVVVFVGGGVCRPDTAKTRLVVVNSFGRKRKEQSIRILHKFANLTVSSICIMLVGTHAAPVQHMLTSSGTISGHADELARLDWHTLLHRF